MFGFGFDGQNEDIVSVTSTRVGCFRGGRVQLPVVHSNKRALYLFIVLLLFFYTHSHELIHFIGRVLHSSESVEFISWVLTASAAS